MTQILKKENLYTLLLILTIGVGYFRQYEPVFVIWSLVLLLTIRKSYSVEIIKYCLPFLGILLLASVITCFRSYEPYAIIRDFTYLLKPMMGLLIGYQLFTENSKNPFLKIIYTGVAIAIGHLIAIWMAFFIFHSHNIEDLRLFAGYFSDFEVYVLMLLIFHKKFNIYIPKLQLVVFIIILGVSAFLYLARTHFILATLLFLATNGYLRLTQKSAIIMFSVLIFGVLGYTTIYLSNPKRQAKGIEAFLYKIKIAPFEPFKTRVNAEDWRDFNDNYRSYENILTIAQVSKESNAVIIAGDGLGSTVNLKRKVWLQSSYMQYIPVLHNGFMTALLKSGLIGVGLLLISIRMFFKNVHKETLLLKQLSYLLIGSGIYMIISYWVSLGFYFVPDGKSIFIGYILAYRHLLVKQLSNADEPHALELVVKSP